MQYFRIVFVRLFVRIIRVRHNGCLMIWTVGDRRLLFVRGEMNRNSVMHNGMLCCVVTGTSSSSSGNSSAAVSRSYTNIWLDFRSKTLSLFLLFVIKVYCACLPVLISFAYVCTYFCIRYGNSFKFYLSFIF